MRYAFRSLGLLVIVTCGCASYQARPLELESFASKWRESRLDAEPINTYLSRLSSSRQAKATGSFDPDDGLSLAEAEAVALFFNPQLRRIRAEAEVPLASAQEAGWWPDPQFQASILGFANRGRSGGIGFEAARTTGINSSGFERTPAGFRQKSGGEFIDNPVIVNIGLNVTLPLSGRLAVAQDLAWSEYSVAWRQIAVQEWRLLTELRSAWLSWSVTVERLVLSREYAARLEDVNSTSNRLASVGELKTTDARVLGIELAQQRATIQQLVIQDAQQKLALLALIGLSPDAPFELTPEVVSPVIDVKSSDQEAMLLKRHPQILAALADYEAAEQSLRLEIREQYPDLSIGPTYTLEEGFSRVGGAFGLPLPLWNRNRQAIAEAIAEREAARLRAEATVQTVLGDLARAQTNSALAAQRLDLISNTLAPLVDQQIAETRTLLDLGEINVLVLREALRASLDTKLDILNARLDQATAANQLEQMLKPRWVSAATQRDSEN